MSGETWFNNLPGVVMTEHEITFGRAKVHERSKTVELENWNEENPFCLTLYREDAAVLRYLADVLESFDVPRPEVEEEPEQTIAAEDPAIFGTPKEVASIQKQFGPMFAQ